MKKVKKSNCKFCQNPCKQPGLKDCTKYNPTNIEDDRKELRALQVKRIDNDRRKELQRKLDFLDYGMK